MGLGGARRGVRNDVAGGGAFKRIYNAAQGVHHQGSNSGVPSERKHQSAPDMELLASGRGRQSKSTTHGVFGAA